MSEIPEAKELMADEIKSVQLVLGSTVTETEILGALSATGINVQRAINFLLDAWSIKKGTVDTGFENKPTLKKHEPAPAKEEIGFPKTGFDKKGSSPKFVKIEEEDSGDNFEILTESHAGKYLNPRPIRAVRPPDAVNNERRQSSPEIDDAELEEFPVETHWVLLGKSYVSAQSTTKGKGKLESGEIVYFKFPTEKLYDFKRKYGDKLVSAKTAAAATEIVRLWTKRCGEIGRLPPEWSRCLVPLVNESKVQIKGRCVDSPPQLSIMQSIILHVSVYIHRSVFTEGEVSLNFNGNKNQYVDPVTHPLPTLFKFLQITPSKTSAYTAEELDGRKRSLGCREDEEDPTVGLAKRLKGETAYIEPSKDNEEQAISEASLNMLVGAAEVYDLQEAEPCWRLTCGLRPYQRQALYWMTELENGKDLPQAERTLHPCWSAYTIGDGRCPAIYVNIFSGEATTKFPSATQMQRGGILADAMGLGKTVMTISLILEKPRGQRCDDYDRIEGGTESSIIKGGTLIVCPMALLGQWKDEINTHSEPGSISVFVHYGGARSGDARFIASNDVVLTTYGVLSSSYRNGSQNIFHRIDWYRVVLDEAHTIKNSRSQVAQASFALRSRCRWCLTGTPLQNSLGDLYSLLCFLQVEPWKDWFWWQKLVQVPYERGDERGLKMVKAILRPLMLRRTKDSKDKYGRPILVLPPVNIEVVECEHSEAERDFYEALFQRSKVKFNEFVAQGKVLHNYASILELLLRLRQCCNHPFLVMSGADTNKYTDLNQLAGRFLEGSSEKSSSCKPSTAYVEKVVEEIRHGQVRECPICLESCDDPVLTPCAHRLCRECLLGSWRTPSGGLCPICRSTVALKDLITCPSVNRVQFDPEKNWRGSCKVTKLIEMLESIETSGSGEKSIVFSQWASFLDLLEITLGKKKMGYLRYDGSLQQKQREKVLKEFRESNDKQVLLMSLRAGGVGLNLTAASNVFLMDPWWNPAVEEQAIMRIHRIGQKRTVHVRRFIVKETVEDRLIQIQVKKQRMISGALTDEEIRTARIEELKMLFR